MIHSVRDAANPSLLEEKRTFLAGVVPNPKRHFATFKCRIAKALGSMRLSLIRDLIS
jgi:hypothetical protein